MSTDLAASVIVCTHNRSRQLTEACEAILAMDYPAERWEMILVDNRSTDDTPEVARAFAAARPERVRVIEEGELGLSAARNAGVRAARGEILAFLDDDAFPEPGWLAAVVEAMAPADVHAVGGPVDPLFDGPPPEWLGERFLPYLTVWDLGPEIVELSYNEFPRGANMAFRRQAFELAGPFSPHLGRKGKRLLSCEETELCLRLERLGKRVLYVPGARVRHRVGVTRATPAWLAARFEAQGRSEAVVDWRHGGLRGLRLGSRRFFANALAARRDPSPDGLVLRRCQARSLLGYLKGALTAPLTVPRYRPPAGARPWRPLG